MLMVILASFILNACTAEASPSDNRKRLSTIHNSAMEIITRINYQLGKQMELDAKLFDVDIRWPRYSTADVRRNKRAAIKFKTRLWPNGEIPYILENNIKKRPYYVYIIRKAMQEWERWTCIKFKKRTTESAYVRFYYGRGCSSHVGYYYGQTNDVSLGKGCGRFKIVLHELGHVIGFYHEHSRPDRDNFVTIIWNNIHPRYRFSFRKVKPWMVSSRGVKYDYRSIMHYGMWSFTKNGRITIKPKDSRIQYYGGNRLSELDKKQANLMYGCQRRPAVYPQDFSWEDHDVKNKRCLRIYEPRDPFWREKYLCYKGSLRDLGLVWSHRGRIPRLDCIRVRIPFRPWWTSWYNNYLCAPKDYMYKFYWSPFGPRRGMGCTKVRDEYRMKFYYLCAKEVLHSNSVTPESSWSQWSSWSSCSKDCGGGVRERRRKCYTQNGKNKCKGAVVEYKICNIQVCAGWPLWKSDFAFGLFKSNPSEMACIKIYERWEYSKWKNVRLCWNNRGKEWSPLWSDSGRIEGMRCTQIYDARYTRWWRDNFLCFPMDTPYRFRWSVRGPLPDSECMQWKHSLKGWKQNFLCATNKTECPRYWTTYKNRDSTHCYFKSTERRSWSNANIHCRQLKANLLSIFDWKEANFVWKNVIRHTSVWIGLNDRWQESIWHWSDGKPLGYTNWDRGDPNNGGIHNNEDCAMIKSFNNKWNDFPCDTKFQYICKLSLIK